MHVLCFFVGYERMWEGQCGPELPVRCDIEKRVRYTGTFWHFIDFSVFLYNLFIYSVYTLSNGTEVQSKQCGPRSDTAYQDLNFLHFI